MISSSLLRVDSNAKILRALGVDSPELEIGREEFILLWNRYKFRVKTFQESRPLTGVNVGLLNKLVRHLISLSKYSPSQVNADQDYAGRAFPVVVS